MKLKHVMWATCILIGLMALSALLLAIHIYFILVPFSLLLVLAIIHFAYFRCSSCGDYLGRSLGKHCPHCGQELDWT